MAKQKETSKPNVLVNYLKAGFPLIVLPTPEEGRAEAMIIDAAKQTERLIFNWSLTEGLLGSDGKKVADKLEDPIACLGYIMANAKNKMAAEKPTIFIMRDLHPHFSGQYGPRIVRMLRDCARELKLIEHHIVLISPTVKVPVDLDRDVTLVEFNLPDGEILGQVWDTLASGNKEIAVDDDERERIIQAAKGLTSQEAESAYAKAVIDSRSIEKATGEKVPYNTLVLKEKAIAVKKTGLLEYSETHASMADIGGLNIFKNWMDVRKSAFSLKAREYGLPMPRGVILVGLPGCGKSLLAKICSGRFGMPLIRFDLARVFAGLVGQSEQNMRTALNFIDSVGNCVVWMDELEKALSGAGGGGDTSTSGVGSRVFGTFLTWMQEKTSPSFVVATVNNIEGLPPELLRKGRFDEIFYVGLPDEQEREEIFKIHIEKRGRKVKDFDLKELVADSDKFSGAEIEEAIISGMFKAFSLNKEVSHDHVHAAVLQTTPLAESRAADIERMAHWAKMNALCASESLEKQIKGEDRARKLSKR